MMRLSQTMKTYLESLSEVFSKKLTILTFPEYGIA